MRWGAVVISCLVFPALCAAQCPRGSDVYAQCAANGTMRSAVPSWEQPGYFFPPDDSDPLQWAITREEPEEQEFELPKLQLGAGPEVSYRKREVTLSQDCWQFTFRSFSKVSLYCHSTF